MLSLIQLEYSNESAAEYVKNRATSKYKYLSTVVSMINGIREIADKNLIDDLDAFSGIKSLPEHFIESYFLDKEVKVIYITPNGVSDKDASIIYDIVLKRDSSIENTKYIGDLVNIDHNPKWELVLEILEEIYGK